MAINAGYFIAQKDQDGSPGRPIGNEDGAIMLFDDLAVARKVRDDSLAECGQMYIWRVNISILGEVAA